jgi:predicted O-methyltransferase YrrM
VELNDGTGFSGESWPQYREEIDRFIALLLREGVRSFLEVGCRYGDTLHAVGLALPEGSRLTGVDWGKSFVHEPGRRKRRAPSDFKRGCLLRCAEDLTARGRRTNIVFGDSRAAGTRQLAMLGGPYDAVFIDGDHSRDGVEEDWKRYGPMSRGIVAFHDVCSDGVRLTGPGALFRILAATRRHETISVDAKRRGIGVIWTA